MANIQKANQSAAFEAISADTGVDVARIKSFMESKGISDPSQLVGNDDLLTELMSGSAIAPAEPPKPPARKGRGKKGQQAANIEEPNYEAPRSGLQTWQQDTAEKLDVIHEEFDNHLTSVEESEAGQIVNRCNQVIPNILAIADRELGRNRGNIDSFRKSFRAALGSNASTNSAS